MTTRQRQPISSPQLTSRQQSHDPHSQDSQKDRWLNFSLGMEDATFQIPHAVNASSNNLLLDDDDLDFLCAGDYTITAPRALSRASTPAARSKNHNKLPSKLDRTQHECDDRQLEGEGSENGQDHQMMPMPQGCSATKRVTVTNTLQTPRAGNASLRSPPYRSRDGYRPPIDFPGVDSVRRSPLLNPSLPACAAESALVASPSPSRTERIAKGDHSSEHNATFGSRKLLDVLIASSQAPSTATIGARSTTKSAVASSASTATNASSSAIVSATSRPAVRPLSPENIGCSTHKNQPGGDHGEAEHVDASSLRSKTPRPSEHALMGDAVRPRPSSLRESSFLDKGSGLSAISETGGCEAEIEVGSHDLPDAVTGAAHAGNSIPLKEVDEDLRASRGTASIPKIGKVAPTTGAKVVIRMKDKAVIDKGKKRKAEVEQLRVKKAPRTVPLSSSAPAIKAVEKRTVKSDQTRTLEIDFKPERGETLGGLLDVKKTKKESKSLSDKTTEMKANSAFPSDVSENDPTKVHPPTRAAAHDIGRTQHEANAAHETLQRCDVGEEPQHIEHQQEPQTTSASRGTAFPIAGGEALDTRRVSAKPVFESQRTKIRDLNLRKLTKRPPRTSKVKLAVMSEAYSSKDKTEARATTIPPHREYDAQATHDSVPATSCLLTDAPMVSSTRIAECHPPIQLPQAGARCAARPPTPVLGQSSSDSRVGQGSNCAIAMETNPLPHSTYEGESGCGSTIALAASVQFAKHTLIPDSTVTRAGMDPSLSGPMESAGSDLAMDEVVSKPLETIAESSSPVAQSISGVREPATATSGPPQSTSTQSLNTSDVKSKPVRRLNGNERTTMVSSGQKQHKPPADDMFERKKRDTYLRKGIDLTAHSTSRFQRTDTRQKKTTHDRTGSRPISGDYDKSSKQRSSADVLTVSGRTASALGQSKPIPTLQSTDTSGVITSEREQTNVVHSIPDRSKPPETSYLSSSHQNGEIINARQSMANKHSKSSSAREPTKHVEKEEQQDPANTSTSSLGNAITERIFSFGQKLIGTIGLMSSQSEHKEAREKIESRDSVPIGQDSRASPLRLSELSPRKINNQMTHPTKLRHGHPDSWNYENTSSAPDIHRPDALADAPISRKRSSRGNGVGNSEEEHIEDLDIEERSRKRSKLDEANAGDSELPGINVPKGLHSRHVSVKASQNVVRSGILASSEPAKAREARSNVNTAGSTYLQRQNSTASKSRNKGKPNYFCKLTVPVTTTFTGDLLRQKRAEAKAEREGSENGKNSQRTDRLTKSADSITFAEKARPPLSDKLPNTNTLSRSTVPQAFHFETDARMIHRRQDFNEKMKTWEKRVASNSSSSSNGLSHTQKPIPDFKSVHAAQSTLISDMAARRRGMIKPTVPVTPHFSTDQRLAEREKFEQARRAREEELERQLAAEQRLREEEEERAYQEARKRTVPRANPIPDWYSNVPKKTRVGIEP